MNKKERNPVSAGFSVKKKALSAHTAAIVLKIVYLISLVPMLVISFDNYPSADDFAMTDTVRYAIEAHRNFFTWIGACLQFAWHDYMNYTGYFTSAFLTAMNPAVFGEQYYVIVFPIIITVLSLSFLYMMRCILVRALKADKDLADIISILALFLMVQVSPDTQMRVEGFYWFSGAVNYTFMFSLGMVYVGSLVTLIYGRRGKRENKGFSAFFIPSFVGFLVGGGNYLTALTCAILSVVFLFYCYVLRKIPKRITLPCLCMLAGFLISCAAPGNRIRGGSTQGMGAIRSILVALHYTLSYCVSEWTTWAAVCIFMLMVPALWKISGQIRATCSHPVLMIFFGYGIVSANIAPALFAVGNIAAGRIRVLFWMQYVITVTLLLVYLFGFIRSHLLQRTGNSVTNSEIRNHRFGSVSVSFLCGLAVLLVCGSAMDIHLDPDYYAFTSATADLLNGSAAQYRTECRQRTRIMNDATIQNAQLQEFSSKPVILFFSDIDPDPDNWINQAEAVYYHKQSVVLIVAPEAGSQE